MNRSSLSNRGIHRAGTAVVVAAVILATTLGCDDENKLTISEPDESRVQQPEAESAEPPDEMATAEEDDAPTRPAAIDRPRKPAADPAAAVEMARARIGYALTQTDLAILEREDDWIFYALKDGLEHGDLRPFLDVLAERVERRKPARHTGLSFFGLGFANTVRKHAPRLDALPREQHFYNPTDASRARAFDHLFEPSIGEPLYEDRTEAKLRPDAVDALTDRLEELLREDDHFGGPWLGTPVADLIDDHIVIFRQYWLAYRLLTDDPGRDRVAEVYRQNLAEYRDRLEQRNWRYDGDRPSMTPFLRAYVVEHELASRIDDAGDIDTYHDYVAVGFWMRRIHDDTDRILFEALDRFLADYDQAFHQRVEGP